MQDLTRLGCKAGRQSEDVPNSDQYQHDVVEALDNGPGEYMASSLGLGAARCPFVGREAGRCGGFGKGQCARRPRG